MQGGLFAQGSPLPAYNSRLQHTPVHTQTHEACGQNAPLPQLCERRFFCENALLGNLQENSPSVKIKMLALVIQRQKNPAQWVFTSTIVKLFHRRPLLAGGKCPEKSNIPQWNIYGGRAVHLNSHEDSGGKKKKDMTRAHPACSCGITQASS